VDEAIASFQQAIRINPKLALAHTNLGFVLYAKGQEDKAIAPFREALLLDPKNATAHYNLGYALQTNGQREEAIVQYQQAIQIDPKLAPAHGALGKVLLVQGRFQEARDSMQRCLDLLPPPSPLRPFVSTLLRQCKQLLALEGRLPAVLRGDDKPPPDQCLGFAELCLRTKRYRTAARLYADAFAAQPKLVDDPQADHRYNASCAAVRAAAEQGTETAKLDDKERARLRKQALNWLQADLAAQTKLLEGWLPAQAHHTRDKIRHWQKDPDLASLRQPEALARLPQAERRDWQQLWADVTTLLEKSHGKP
jgi:serine/threonine-protein kinase